MARQDTLPGFAVVNVLYTHIILNHAGETIVYIYYYNIMALIGCKNFNGFLLLLLFKYLKRVDISVHKTLLSICVLFT